MLKPELAVVPEELVVGTLAPVENMLIASVSGESNATLRAAVLPEMPEEVAPGQSWATTAPAVEIMADPTKLGGVLILSKIPLKPDIPSPK